MEIKNIEHTPEGESIDRLVEGDRCFFARYQRRNHRLRYAGQVEIEYEAKTISGMETELPPGCRWFTIVKRIGSGVRLRALAALPETTDTDLSESECEKLFSRLGRPK